MLTRLKLILQEVSALDNSENILKLLVNRIAQALETEACSIFLIDHAKNEYVLAATKGLNLDSVGKVRFSAHEGLIGLVGQREAPINLDNAPAHPQFLSIPQVHEEAFHAFLGVPVVYQRRLLGVLIIQQRESRRYDESEEAFLTTLATQLATIIAHAEAVGTLDKLFPNPHSLLEKSYSGLPGAPGIGIGIGVMKTKFTALESIPDQPVKDIEAEIIAVKQAFAAVKNDLGAMSEKLYHNIPAEERALFDVYQGIIESPELLQEVITHIKAGNWAPGALRQTMLAHTRLLEQLDNDYMRERSADIRDLGQRVLAYLQNSTSKKPRYAEKTILLGEMVTATDIAEAPEGSLAGIISTSGSSNSHVAILARAMRIPAVMGLDDAPLHRFQSQEIIIDGNYGQIYLAPDPVLKNEFLHLIEEECKLTAILDEAGSLPAITPDDYKISLMVNTGLGADISIALEAGADGVGLYRSEIPFLIRDRFPSVEEQRIIYRQLLTSFSPRPVILRTLDVGGDKPLSYFPIKEDNPFLGWRGIRITLDHPEIFLAQIRAMLKASLGLNNMRIMLPLISDVSEVDEAKRLIDKAYDEVVSEGYSIQKPQLGVMVEVPAAVYLSRALAKRVDFISVGSNDLTQYTLAVDRNNPRVARLYDALNPAVLRALLYVVENAHLEAKHVSICGEMAGDPAAAILLLAMGFDSFSMNASSISRIRWLIRHFPKQKAARILHEVLSMESAAAIRQHLELALEKAGLGNLIRSGK